jgi:hypothetical protein
MLLIEIWRVPAPCADHIRFVASTSGSSKAEVGKLLFLSSKCKATSSEL